MKRFVRLFALLVSLVTTPAFAELCPPCKGRVYTTDIGVCKECGGTTSSGAFQLCPACSAKLHQCEHCRAALRPAEPIALTQDHVYVSGRWEYRYTVSNRDSRSEGYFGQLLLDGQALGEPPALNDYHQTPWGPMYWVGNPVVAFGVHGWMPKPLPSRKVGQLLSVPAAPAVSTR